MICANRIKNIKWSHFIYPFPSQCAIYTDCDFSHSGRSAHQLSLSLSASIYIYSLYRKLDSNWRERERRLVRATRIFFIAHLLPLRMYIHTMTKFYFSFIYSSSQKAALFLLFKYVLACARLVFNSRLYINVCWFEREKHVLHFIIPIRMFFILYDWRVPLFYLAFNVWWWVYIRWLCWRGTCVYIYIYIYHREICFEYTKSINLFRIFFLALLAIKDCLIM